MKKKLSMIICTACIVIMALGLTACGENVERDGFYELTYDEICQQMEQSVAALVSGDTAYLEDEYGAKLAKSLEESWADAIDGLGSYQGLDELTATLANGTLTMEQNVAYSERDVVLTHVYEYDYTDEQVEITDANADLVYSFGEKMKQALMNMLMGLLIVFVMLIVISLIIYCFNIIPFLQKKFGKKKPDTPANSPVVSQIEKKEEIIQEQAGDDLELVAVISAAVAAASGTSADGFVVRSIRRRR